MQIGDRLPTIALQTPEGQDTTLEQFLDRPQVVALPRYYG